MRVLCDRPTGQHTFGWTFFSCGVSVRIVTAVEGCASTFRYRRWSRVFLALGVLAVYVFLHLGDCTHDHVSQVGTGVTLAAHAIGDTPAPQTHSPCHRKHAPSESAHVRCLALRPEMVVTGIVLLVAFAIAGLSASRVCASAGGPLSSSRLLATPPWHSGTGMLLITCVSRR